MFEILKKSFIYCFVCKVISFFEQSYEKSGFKIFSDKFKNIFRQSSFFRIVKNYFDREPFFISSKTYKGIKFAGGHLGKFADSLNKSLVGTFDKSNVKKTVDDIKEEDISEKLIVGGLFFMITSLSYLIFSIILGMNYEYRIYVSWGIFFIGMLLVSAGKNLECVKQSVIFRIVKYIVELVKM